MAYHSKYTGAEVDALLDKIKDDDVGDIDSSLSTESENPVMNKVVTEELGKKATKTELSALETKVTENKTATDKAVSDLSAKVDEEVESMQTQLDSHDILIEDLQENKADEIGYYPQLSVGQADNLPDRGDVTEGLLGFRESAGVGNSIEDGTANVQELCGESVVWNQLMPTKTQSMNLAVGVTVGFKDGYVELSGTITNKTNITYPLNCTLHNGHTYFVDVSKTMPDGFAIGITNVGNTDMTHIKKSAIVKKDNYYSSIYICGVQPEQVAGTVYDFSAKVRVVDLTLMFGAGNEPTTVEEFYARVNQIVGVDLNAYNVGEVLGVNINGIKSVNDNAWDEEWELGSFSANNGEPATTTVAIRPKNFIKVLPNTQYYIVCPHEEYLLFYDENQQFISSTWTAGTTIFLTPSNCKYFKFRVGSKYGATYNNDICIRLAHTGYKTDYVAHEESESPFDLTPYFPYGMHGVNGVRDSVTKNKAVRRFGKVDLGTLSWIKNDEGQFYATLPNNGVGTSSSDVGLNIKCVKYLSGNAFNKNNGICTVNTRVWVYDPSYTDAASFKAAMSGIELVYELATPIEKEIDPQLNMNYKVWDFGTEELLTDGKSAPVLARTIYGFNATDTIRGNKAKNEEQDARLDEIEQTMVQKTDYAPSLTAGFADNLVSGDVDVDREFNVRQSGGGAISDGVARMKVVKGNSVVWNQLIDFLKYYTYNSTTKAEVEDKVITITKVENAGAGAIIRYPVNVIDGHKYFMAATASTDGSTSFNLHFSADIAVSSNALVSTTSTTPTTIAQIVTANAEIAKYLILRYGTGTSPTGIAATIYGVTLVDLTLMFGAGNEPTTVEEFYARRPQNIDKSAYNAGEVIHCNVDAVKSVGRNVWDEEWEVGYINTDGANANGAGQFRSKNYIRVIPNSSYHYGGPQSCVVVFYDQNKKIIGDRLTVNVNKTFTTPTNCVYIRFFILVYPYNNNICINISDPYFNGQYEPYREDVREIPSAIKAAFPEGMMSMTSNYGTTKDFAYNDLNKEVGVTENRVEQIVFTSCYSVQSVNDANVVNITLVGNSDKYSDAVVLKYEQQHTGIASTTTEGFLTSITDGKFTLYFRLLSSTIGGSTKAEVNAYLASHPVTALLKLTTPVITEHDEPFNLDYEVTNGGQEQAIATNPTTPFKAEIVYGFNASAKIKENANEIAQLKATIAELQAAIASMVSTTTEEVE